MNFFNCNYILEKKLKDMLNEIKRNSQKLPFIFEKLINILNVLNEASLNNNQYSSIQINYGNDLIQFYANMLSIQQIEQLILFFLQKDQISNFVFEFIYIEIKNYIGVLNFNAQNEILQQIEQKLNTIIYSWQLQKEDKERKYKLQLQHIQKREIKEFKNFGFYNGIASIIQTIGGWDNDFYNCDNQTQNVQSNKTTDETKHKSKQKVPFLQIPAQNNSTNILNQIHTYKSRSTRRQEYLTQLMNIQSAVSIETNSTVINQKRNLMNNIFDKFSTSQKKLENLGCSIGENYLTIDIGCVLSQKRKQQLDQVAMIRKESQIPNDEVQMFMKIKMDSQTSQNSVRTSQRKVKKNFLNKQIQNKNIISIFYLFKLLYIIIQRSEQSLNKENKSSYCQIIHKIIELNSFYQSIAKKFKQRFDFFERFIQTKCVLQTFKEKKQKQSLKYFQDLEQNSVSKFFFKFIVEILMKDDLSHHLLKTIKNKNFFKEQEEQNFIKKLYFNSCNDEDMAHNILYVLRQKILNLLNFYDLKSEIVLKEEKRMLNLLISLLTFNRSRISSIEFLQYFIDIIQMIKDQFQEITNAQVQLLQSQNISLLPNTSQRSILQSSNRNIINKDKPFYSKSSHNILQTMLNHKSSQSQYFQQEDQMILKYHLLSSNRNFSFENLYIIQNSKLFSCYLNILSHILYNIHNQKEAQKVMIKIFLNNRNWQELVQIFTIGQYQEIMAQKMNKQFIISCSQFYTSLSYYKSVLIFVEDLIADKMQNQQKNKQEKINQKIISIISSMEYLIDSQTGIITNLLSKLLNLINYKQSKQYDEDECEQFQLLIEISEYLTLFFSLSNQFQPFISFETISYYIKISYLSYVKLYSFSSNQELNDINQKIEAVKVKMEKEKTNESQITFRFGDQEYLEQLQIIKNTLIINYLKILFAFSINRNEAVSQLLFNLKIVQFFTREIDLEHEIVQIRQRYIQLQKSSQRSAFQSIFSKNNSSKQTIEEVIMMQKLQSQKQNVSKIQQYYSNEQQHKVPQKLSIPQININNLNKQHLSSNSSTPQNNSAVNNKFIKIYKDNVSNSKLKLNLERHKQKNQQIINNPILQMTDQLIPSAHTNLEEKLTENLFYFSERKLRKIYDNDILHSLAISLMLSIILTPQRGTLDTRYCSQYPLEENKPNILFLLHFHLNHPSNHQVIPYISKFLSLYNSFPSGQRILKLLTIHLSDFSFYSDFQLIEKGAYGQVYEAKTMLQYPQKVAIKLCPLPKQIEDRCVLNDIFTEITCLEEFRSANYVTDIYDYGVNESNYIIIMKLYPFSLKQWRQSVNQITDDNIDLILNLFSQILSAIQKLHQNKVTHYDIKADNILIDFLFDNYQIVLADFGECKMFTNEQDEYCLRNRGTEYIKSPEMLQQTLNKTHEKFDRRKKQGTTRSSDIWSLGCLFYEILTGKFLFFNEEWVKFYYQVTFASEKILNTEAKKALAEQFPLHYKQIKSFMKAILIREPNHRLSIENLTTLFNKTFQSSGTYNKNNFINFINTSSNELQTTSFEISKIIKQEFEKENFQNQICQNQNFIIKIFKDILFVSNSNPQLNEICGKIKENQITHIVILKDDKDDNINYKDKYFYLQNFANLRCLILQNQRQLVLFFLLMDFLKEIIIYRGKLLIIEQPSHSILKDTLMLWLSYITKLSFFEIYNIIKNQALLSCHKHNQLQFLSLVKQQINQIFDYLKKFKIFQCICGSCSIYVKSQHLQESHKIKCSCFGYQKKLCHQSFICLDYLIFLKEKFMLNWNSISWIQLQQNAFLISPFNANFKQATEESLIITQNLYLNIEQFPNDQFSLQQYFRCKICQMWLYSLNTQLKTVNLILNNLIKNQNHNNLFNFFLNPILKNINLYEIK